MPISPHMQFESPAVSQFVLGEVGQQCLPSCYKHLPPSFFFPGIRVGLCYVGLAGVSGTTTTRGAAVDSGGPEALECAPGIGGWGKITGRRLCQLLQPSWRSGSGSSPRCHTWRRPG